MVLFGVQHSAVQMYLEIASIAINSCEQCGACQVAPLHPQNIIHMEHAPAWFDSVPGTQQSSCYMTVDLRPPVKLLPFSLLLRLYLLQCPLQA